MCAIDKRFDGMDSKNRAIIARFDIGGAFAFCCFSPKGKVNSRLTSPYCKDYPAYMTQSGWQWNITHNMEHVLIIWSDS